MRYYLILVVFVVLSSNTSAQVHEIQLSKKSNSVSTRVQERGIHFNFNQDKLLSTEKATNNGQTYTELWFKGSFPTGEIGSPKLPAYKKLIRIPRGSKPVVNVNSYSQESFSLKSKGLKNPIIPNQLSIRKDQDSTKVKFEIKKEAYSKNEYKNQPIAKIEILGTLRSATIARLIVSPVDYNPVDGSIKVYNNIDVNVDFENVDPEAEQTQIAKTSSPYFDVVYQSYASGTNSSFDLHPDLTKYPVKMLIVSNRIFEQSLQQFIEWKKLKGFNVITAYTDVIGTSATQIKSYIQQQYNAATPENPAPTFLVLVGDIAQLPMSDYGSATGSATDLYYASVDGDMFPDMYYGRLSATTTTQLDNIISKILYYEKYQFADPTYLNKATLIAGVDGSWNYKVGQPTIKYSTANYFNASHGYSTVNEFGVTSDPNNPNATSTYTNCYANDQISVGIINYTAHGSETSWVDPSLRTTSIAGFTNSNKYPLAIGNCCLSGDFGYSECLGEAWIRGQNKGAVTYIGSAPNTFWLEDFYWAVGAFPLVGENNGYVPTFQESTVGVYDAPFISKYVTTGAMVFAGNLAVTEADIQGYNNASSPIYYWQAYNVLGDPSLIPYFSEGEVNQINHRETITVGESLFKISTLDGSYIAITKNNQLIGTLFNSKTGEVEVPITPITSTGDVIIVVTRPQTIPYIDTITAISPTGPYLLLNTFSIDDHLANGNGKADFNEEVAVNLKIKNIGIEKATNVKVKITGIDSNISLTSQDSISTADIPNLDGANILDVTSAFTFKVQENIPDQHSTNFILDFYSDQGNWSSKLKMVLNSPILSLEEVQINDSISGNNDGFLNPGESSHAYFKIVNSGHAKAMDISCSILVPDSIQNILQENTIQVEPFSIDANSSFNFPFRVSANPDYYNEIQLPLNISMNVSEPSSLSKTYLRYIKLIPKDTARIHNDTLETCFTYFYDSGGKNGNYTNSENFIQTFVAKKEFSTLRVKFSEFSTEQSYDYLYVFNGPNNTYPQVAGSPFSGKTIPSEIVSSSRYLTFRFKSDDNTISKGWVATIECITPQSIPDCATNPTPATGALHIESGILSWAIPQSASYYDVYIGTAPNKLGLAGRVVTPKFTLNLEKNKKYYWRVLPGNYLGTNTSACETWNFTTDTICNQALMSTSTIVVDTMYFYDSGGPLSTYRNYEDDTLTFKPKYPNNKVEVKFIDFSVESQSSCNYDKLTIFNGPSITSPLIGGYCGTNSPNTVKSTSADGALTFLFHSDFNEALSGWRAIVRSIGETNLQTLSFSIKSNGVPIPNANISINGTVKTSDQNGIVIFKVVQGIVNYSVTALGYEKITNQLVVSSSNLDVLVDLLKLQSVNLHFTDAIKSTPLSGVKVIYGSDSTYTNLTGNTMVSMTLGNHSIIASVKGYEQLSFSLNVTSNLTNQEITLSPKKYFVSLTVLDSLGGKIEKALITINGKTLLSNALGLVKDSLTWGSYNIGTAKEGFYSLKTWLLVNDNISQIIQLDRIPKLYNVDFSFLGAGPIDTILLDNADIDVYVNTVLYSKLKTNSLGKSSLNLSKGVFTYDVSKEGYFSSLNNQVIVDGIKSNSIVDTILQKIYNVEFTFFGKGPKDTLLLDNIALKITYDQKDITQLITNSQGKGTTQLPVGNFYLSATREGYNSLLKKPFIITGETYSLIDTLVQLMYNVTFSIKASNNAIQDARVTLDGYIPINSNNQGLATFNGIGYEKNLSYLVQRSGYFDVSGLINVIDSLNLNIDLTENSINVVGGEMIKIYPNPTSDLINIKSENPITRIQIISISGKLLVNNIYSDIFDTILSLEKHPSGVYIIVVTFKNASSTRLLVVKK